MDWRILALALVVAASGCVTSQNATVTDVADGDTLDVSFNGTTETVRLIGVDTPETYGDVNPGEFDVPDTEEGRRCLRKWAEKASNRTKQMKSKEVDLVHNGEKGYYGRLLAYVYLENRSTSYNHLLIKEGYARVYDSDFSQRALFLEAQRNARSREVGLWNCN